MVLAGDGAVDGRDVLRLAKYLAGQDVGQVFNLELLGLSGDVYLTENGEEDGCLLLKTSDGQKMVFILNPAGDNN